MSHFTVMVIGDNPEKQLAPFHEYECTGIEDEYVIFVEAEESKDKLTAEYETYKDDYDSFDEFISDYYGYSKNDAGIIGNKTNPNSKWDWYKLGGRWTGFLKQIDASNGMVGSPGIMTPQPSVGHCDQCLKKNIDVDGMRSQAVGKASERYDLALNIINGEEFESWESARERIDNIDDARDFYNSQPVVERFKRDDNFGYFTSPSEFLTPKDNYLNIASDNAIVTFAFIKDSKWVEKGEMGWFGCVSDAKDESEWIRQLNKEFDALPEDTLISIYDCHI
jgi:hypothetical protein